jgi:ABC-2 type transport system permease protein
MIRVELRLLLSRPRTWISVLLLTALPIVVGIFLRVSGVAPQPGDGPAFLTQVVDNGLLFPAAALAIILPLFLPIAVLILAGESIAGEASAGTLRYLLARPVGRTRFLIAKLASIVLFVLMAVTVVSLVGLVVGTRLFGTGPVPTLSGGPPLSGDQVAGRLALSALYVGASMMGVAAVGVFLSTLTEAPLAATLGALAVLVASGVLDTLDAVGGLRPYLPTHYWLSFVDLFRDPVLWRDIERGLALQAAYVAVLLGAAWAAFSTRDVTS